MVDFTPLSTIMNNIYEVEDRTSMSLSQFVKRSLISSRVFIDNTLTGEDILTPLMQNLMNMYAGFVTTALGMSQYCTGTKKVRDMMTIVATEDFNKPVLLADEMITNFFAGMESSDDKVSIVGTKQEQMKDDTSLPSGRIINVELNVNGNRVKFDMYMQLSPTFIPADVARQFIQLNFTPSFAQRWLQVKAGEISMINDLLLASDIRRQRLRMLKKDKSGALQEMIDRQQNSLENSWMKLSQLESQRQNIANTILIFEKNNFNKACNASGIKFDNPNDRQRFFTKSFTFMVAVIDPMYNKVQIYYHGLPSASTFTFEQLKKNAKTENTDIMAMIKAYAAGVAPKF